MKADLGFVTGAVSIGRDETRDRKIGDQLVGTGDAGQVDGCGCTTHRVDRLPDFGLVGPSDEGFEECCVIFEDRREGQFNVVAPHCAG